ncbi:uncharacterized protein LOC130450291 [Diorhabda sublineata]|uniref:uncharacterized protein LOC130450291 n=1 Tax=Diorhabda sublineata TaxID=1163346 RepID=UPI0024E0D79B|nr:uncharacterized protein LOC130450291 [Diorhabda sublineata]
MNSNANRLSYIEEDIEIKPSAELIPDEYKHFTEPNQKIFLYTFTKNGEIYESSERIFLTTMDNYGYVFANKYNLDKDNLKEALEKIAKSCNNDVAGLILFFSGNVTKYSYFESDIPENRIAIHNIWLGFNSSSCLQLKNKPKIFIFDLIVTPTLIQTDGRLIHKGYDTPAEADILVICNKSEGATDFVYQFCENIKEYGETENIITLASCVDEDTPLVISTLTRNFYFTPSFSNSRGNYRIIEKHQEDIRSQIDNLKKTAIKHTEKKKKSSILDSFRLGKKQKDEEVFAEPEVSSKDIKKAPSDTSSSSMSTGHKSITSLIQSRGYSGTNYQRTRLMSQTEPEGSRSSTKKKNENKKPIWKP